MKIDLESIKTALEDVNYNYLISDSDLRGYRESALRAILTVLFDHVEGATVGLYAHPESVGFIGWADDGERTLYFAPTKLVILDNKIAR